MQYKTIEYRKKGTIAYIVPSSQGGVRSKNANTYAELADVCDIINQDDSVSVVAIKMYRGTFSFNPNESTATICEAIDAVSRLEKIVVAVINGNAVGVGLELALACDIRIASDKSNFALLNVAEGTIPSSGGTQRLPRLIGQSKALELILTANSIDAAEAFRIGLIQKLVFSKDIDKEANILVRKIADKAPIALRFCKEAVNKGMDLTLEQGLRMEADLYFLIQTTSDRMEGIKSFLEKRLPNFKGK